MTATTFSATLIAIRGKHRTAIVTRILLAVGAGFALDIHRRGPGQGDESDEHEDRCSTMTPAFNEKHYLHGGIG